MSPEDHANDNGQAEQPHGHAEPGSPEDYPPVIVGHEDLGTATKKLHEQLKANAAGANESKKGEGAAEPHGENKESHGEDHGEKGHHEQPWFLKRQAKKFWGEMWGGELKKAAKTAVWTGVVSGVAVEGGIATATAGTALAMGAAHTIGAIFGINVPVNFALVSQMAGTLLPAGVLVAALTAIPIILALVQKLVTGAAPKLFGASGGAASHDTHH
jgi:hypothetical protein